MDLLCANGKSNDLSAVVLFDVEGLYAATRRGKLAAISSNCTTSRFPLLYLDDNVPFSPR
jgi:hypothetical protein